MDGTVEMTQNTVDEIDNKIRIQNVPMGHTVGRYNRLRRNS